MQPMQPPIVIKQGTSTAAVSMQPGMVTVPMTVNSSMAGSIPNVMTLNKPGGQNVVVTTQNLGAGQPAILPNVQILNMRPGAPSVAAQKSVATVSPRVVIGSPQVVGTRAAAPGITLQTLQSLQPGQQGHLLLKTENGQYQLLRVGPAPSTSALAAPPSQTIRLSTVPAHPGVATVSTSVAQQSGLPAQLQSALGSPAVHAAVSSAGLASAPPPQQHHQQPTTSAYVKPSDNTKEKCRNFLANLLDLSSKEPPSVEMNVRNLIQELIDAQVEPEEFCDRLERLLNASPQPCLIGFLKKSLPLLRQSLVTKELVIEGINPPAPHVAFATAPLSTPMPVMPAANVQMTQPAVNLSLESADEFVFKVPFRPAPRRKRVLSTSAIAKDEQQNFSKNEGTKPMFKITTLPFQSATPNKKESCIKITPPSTSVQSGHTKSSAAAEGNSSKNYPDCNSNDEKWNLPSIDKPKKEVKAMIESHEIPLPSMFVHAGPIAAAAAEERNASKTNSYDKISKKNRNFLFFTAQKKKSAEVTETREIKLPSTAVQSTAVAAEEKTSKNDFDYNAPSEDLSKPTLVSYFHSFLSEIYQKENIKELNDFHEIPLPSTVQATEAAAAIQESSSENDSDDQVVIPEDMNFSYDPEKRENGNPLNESVVIQDKTPPPLTGEAADAAIKEDSSNNESNEDSDKHINNSMSSRFREFVVTSGNNTDQDIHSPGISTCDDSFEILDSSRIRHYNNFVQTLAEEVRKLPAIVALRLELEIQQSVESAKKIAFENKDNAPMKKSTLSRLSGHYFFETEDNSSDEDVSFSKI